MALIFIRSLLPLASWPEAKKELITTGFGLPVIARLLLFRFFLNKSAGFVHGYAILTTEFCACATVGCPGLCRENSCFSAAQKALRVSLPLAATQGVFVQRYFR